MATYLVAYTVLGNGKQAIGTGAIEWHMDTPASLDEVAELGKRITEFSHGTGSLPPGNSVAVTAWSLMEGN